METPDHTPSSDEQIRRRLSQGEETALGELYDRYAPLVHGIAGRILDDQQAAEQLTREVFAQLWQHPEEFDPAQGSLHSWLGSLTHRRAVARLRLSRNGDSAAESTVQARLTAARVQYVLGTLPDSVREAITMGWFHGLTYRETARRLGISEQTVKHRMRLGVTRLAEALAEEPIEEPLREVLRAVPLLSRP